VPPKIEELRVCTRAVIEENVLLLDADPENFSDRKNIPLVRNEAKVEPANGVEQP